MQFFVSYAVLLHFTHKFIYSPKVEKLKVDLCIALIEEHFYGHPQKHIKGACKILIAGEGPLRVLYNIIEGKTKTELVLKVSCCGRDTVSSYLAGVHLTVQDLITYGVNKKLKGHQLWAMGLIFMHSIKKALSVVTNFAPLICIINKNCAVISYASGKNKSTLMQYVNNGMYTLALSEGD